MQHLDELCDGCLGIVLGVIVAPGNLQGRSTEELGPKGNRSLEGDAIYTTYVVRDEQRIDVSVGIKRRNMTPNPCGRRLVSTPDPNIFDDDVRAPVSILLTGYVRRRKRLL